MSRDDLCHETSGHRSVPSRSADLIVLSVGAAHVVFLMSVKDRDLTCRHLVGGRADKEKIR
jgi:hypothetical protein